MGVSVAAPVQAGRVSIYASQIPSAEYDVGHAPIARLGCTSEIESVCQKLQFPASGAQKTAVGR